ncbi:hypothetical protein K1Y78_61380, partial [Streptomyces sp. tea 10]|nr:hypothetical protein [Streptomyces sp. tea 10]
QYGGRGSVLSVHGDRFPGGPWTVIKSETPRTMTMDVHEPGCQISACEIDCRGPIRAGMRVPRTPTSNFSDLPVLDEHPPIRSNGAIGDYLGTVQ